MDASCVPHGEAGAVVKNRGADKGEGQSPLHEYQHPGYTVMELALHHGSQCSDPATLWQAEAPKSFTLGPMDTQPGLGRDSSMVR